MKKVTITVTQYLKDKDFNSEEYQELVEGLKSGAMKKDLENTSGSKFKFVKTELIYSIEDTDGEA